MTIYAPPPPPFDCVICREPQMRDAFQVRYTPDNPIPPICHRCNEGWGRTIGGYADRNRDRRIIRQVSALAEVIRATAYCKQTGIEEPYART